MKYRRVLLKLSGESLMGDKQFGIDNQRLAIYAKEIKNIYDQKIEQLKEFMIYIYIASSLPSSENKIDAI